MLEIIKIKQFHLSKISSKLSTTEKLRVHGLRQSKVYVTLEEMGFQSIAYLYYITKLSFMFEFLFNYTLISSIKLARQCIS